MLWLNDLVNAALVPSSGKLGREPGAHHRHRHPVGDEARRHHEDVGVVVFLDKAGDLGVPREARADALVVVQAERHPVAGAAEGDPGVHFPLLDGVRQGMGIVRIVAAVRAVRSEIDDFIAFAQQIGDQPGLVVHACVVAADSDSFHGKTKIRIFFISAKSRIFEK